jgi:hypothetical protein
VRLWMVADAAATQRIGGEVPMHQHLDIVFERLRTLYEAPTTEDSADTLAFMPPLQLRLARTTVRRPGT